MVKPLILEITFFLTKYIFFKPGAEKPKSLTYSFLRNTLEKQSIPKLVSKSWVSFHIGRRAMHRVGPVCQEYALSRHRMSGICTERAPCARNMDRVGTMYQEYADLLTLVGHSSG